MAQLLSCITFATTSFTQAKFVLKEKDRGPSRSGFSLGRIGLLFVALLIAGLPSASQLDICRQVPFLPVLFEPFVTSAALASEDEIPLVQKSKFSVGTVEVGQKTYLGRDYSFKVVPKQLDGATYLLRNIPKEALTWLLPDEVIVSRPCTVYAAILWTLNNTVPVQEEQFATLEANGWEIFEDPFETTISKASKGRVEWKLIRRDIDAGAVNLENCAAIKGAHMIFMFTDSAISSAEKMNGKALTVIDHRTMVVIVGVKQETVRLTVKGKVKDALPEAQAEEAKKELMRTYMPGTQVELFPHGRTEDGYLLADIELYDIPTPFQYRGRPRTERWLDQKYKEFRVSIVKVEGKVTDIGRDRSAGFPTILSAYGKIGRLVRLPKGTSVFQVIGDTGILARLPDRDGTLIYLDNIDTKNLVDDNLLTSPLMNCTGTYQYSTVLGAGKKVYKYEVASVEKLSREEFAEALKGGLILKRYQENNGEIVTSEVY